jgi:predicted CoA-binding protein
LREIVRKAVGGDTEGQFLIETEIGSGTIITPLIEYKKEHIRLLRPHGLTQEDAQKVIQFAIGRLGTQYDVRHLLDLARFYFPWGLLPRRWRSTLFEHNALQPTKDICSSMIADAFQSIDYPILPLVEKGYENEIEFIPRNNRLYTPSDFDYSPYFDVIKYPPFSLEHGAYHDLPWKKDVVSDDEGLKMTFISPDLQKFFSSPAYAVVGASADRRKFGNKVLRCYLQQNKTVYPVNPHEKIIEGVACVHQISDLPDNVKSISIITPPAVTEKIVEQAIKKGIQNIWMQPGAESDLAVQLCKQHHINVIADGRCILVELNFHE